MKRDVETEIRSARAVDVSIANFPNPLADLRM